MVGVEYKYVIDGKMWYLKEGVVRRRHFIYSMDQSMLVVLYVVGVSKVESFPNERATHKQKKKKKNKQAKKMKKSNLAIRFCHVTPQNKTKQNKRI